MPQYQVVVHREEDARETSLSDATIVKAVVTALEQRRAPDSEVSIIVADAETVLQLNRDFLDHDYHTDVLAFPMTDSEHSIEGEVYVNAEMAADRAVEFNSTPEKELLRYIVHGTLHLTGLDDSTDELRREMSSLEDAVLSKLDL